MYELMTLNRDKSSKGRERGFVYIYKEGFFNK